MITIVVPDGMFQAYITQSDDRARPGIVLLQEIFGINRVMRDTADSLAGKGFVVVCPDIFWRQQAGVELTDKTKEDWDRAFELYQGLDEAKAVADAAAAMTHLRKLNVCNGQVAAVGFCLGGKLAYLLAARHAPDCAVAYYGVGIESALNEADRIKNPLMLHIAGKDRFCDQAARSEIRKRLATHSQLTLHEYPEQDHAFARVDGEHYDAASAELANLRTLDFLHTHLSNAATSTRLSACPDFAALWEEHVKYEFETRDHNDTLDTMVDDAYVNHVPTLTGGVGKDQLDEFYSKRFIPQMPPDTSMTPVSRTIGSDRLVDEMIFKFTHTIEMDWMLPGVAPTGKCVEIALVVIVHFRDGKLAHEHIYWDQASVLVQLGLLDSMHLPVAGVETARKVLDNTIPSNDLIKRADGRKHRDRS